MATLTQLFPHLSPHLLLSALNHRYFATTAQTAEEQAAPLVDAILRGGDDLPDDLSELKAAVRRDAATQQAAPEKVERRNIWANDELDLSRLRQGKDGSYVFSLDFI